MNLHKRGIRFLLSNSDVPEAREIYSKFNIKVLEVCRRINSNITKRSAVNELAVTNYDVATGELLKIDWVMLSLKRLYRLSKWAPVQETALLRYLPY